ncbi:MAG: HD-GYP domain-containing protein [Gammaproteobacteria bacterium]|nr:HD-GYP domain-containing protein [Gammaproteobacteria bacterium]NNL51212.1 HD-GYP domain-containing protein [Woeseiaceae bacterium]
MSQLKRKIEVTGLCVGMYVSELDRPWLETPFLFQGFFIRSKNEIDELQEHCEFVYIDLEQSFIAANDAHAAKPPQGANTASASQPGRKRGFWQWLLQLFGRKQTPPVAAPPKPGEFYKDTVSVADELAVAKNIHTGSLQSLVDVLNSVRQGATLRVPDLEVVVDGMVDSVLRNSTAMALLVRMQESDDYTHAHSLASSMWALIFGRHLGLDRESLKLVGLGALLLDVGKTKLPQQLLQSTDKLNDAAMRQLRSHVQLGVDLLRADDSIDRRVLDMVATHHERYDGSGYPNGLKGNQIPVFGRIGGIVDSYAAMTSDRPYANAMSSYDAMREFKSLADKSFQAELIEQFIQAIGIFPAGTLVELSTDQIAVVLKEHRTSRLLPEVAVILDADGRKLDDFRIIDLGDQPEEQLSSSGIWIKRGLSPGEFDINLEDYFV